MEPSLKFKVTDIPIGMVSTFNFKEGSMLVRRASPRLPDPDFPPVLPPSLLLFRDFLLSLLFTFCQ